MRWFFAAVLIAHGIAHLAGFAVAWQLMNSPEVPYKTTFISGMIDVGDGGARTIGVLWLLLAVAFLGSAVATILSWAAALPLALAAISASLTLCAIALPETRIGLAVNLVLAMVIAFGPRVGVTVYDRTPTDAQTQGAWR